MAQNNQPSVNPNSKEYRNNLPKVSLLHVLNLVFCFPIFFYPLMMLFSASFKNPPPGYELIMNIIDVIIWIYPVPIFLLCWLFARIWRNNPDRGKKVLITAIIIELVLVYGLVMFLMA